MEQNIYNAIYKVNHAGGCGSCFYLKQYDLFVTNYHVVEGFRQVAIQDNDKNSFLARVVMVNSVLDIALLSGGRGFFCSSGYPVIGVERSRDRTEDKRGRLSVWYAVHSD